MATYTSFADIFHKPPSQLTANEQAVLDKFLDLTANALTARQEWLKRLSDPRRNIDDECGYPTGYQNWQVYKDLYEREAIPARVTEVMAKETWQVQPMVYEDEDPDVTTDFEEAWSRLGRNLRGARSYYQDSEGSPIWEYLARADRLCGIGHYSVVLLGIDDGKPLDQPADLRPEDEDLEGRRIARQPKPEPTPGNEFMLNAELEPGDGPTRRLMYMRVYPQWLAEITAYDNDRNSPRYGQPTEYQITRNNPDAGQTVGSPNSASEKVHWTRVIHVVDNIDDSEIFGVPRMRPVLNRLLDLRKLYGGSAEMYWRGAFPGLSFETHPQLGGDVEIDRQGMRQMYEEYANGLQRALFLMGMTVKTLAPTVVDPTPQIQAQLVAICIKLGIPMRIFMGSERGQLASGQDDAKWNDTLRDRQRGHVTPRIVCLLVDRLIALYVLPVPEGYSVTWPDITSQTQTEKAQVAMSKTQALTQYIQGGGESVIDPFDFLVYFLHFTESEAEAIIENADEHMVEVEEDELAKQHRMIDEGLVADPTAPKVAPPGKNGSSSLKSPPGPGGSRTKPPAGGKNGKKVLPKPPRRRGRPRTDGKQPASKK